MWTRNDLNISSIYISYLATRERIETLFKSEWYSNGLGRYENKQRMKVVYGAGMQYLCFLKRSAILGLAKSVEDCFFLVQENTGRSPNFWRDAHRFEFSEVAKEIRALSNTIKHNISYVQASRSTSAAFLVKTCGYREGSHLDVLMLQDEGIFNIPNTISSMYCFLMSVVELYTGMRHAFLDIPPDKRDAAIREALVPSILNL
jgi:hypothetical protein